jgi:hypothetical protein
VNHHDVRRASTTASLHERVAEAVARGVLAQEHSRTLIADLELIDAAVRATLDSVGARRARAAAQRSETDK